MTGRSVDGDSMDEERDKSMAEKQGIAVRDKNRGDPRVRNSDEKIIDSKICPQALSHCKNHTILQSVKMKVFLTCTVTARCPDTLRHLLFWITWYDQAYPVVSCS